MSTARYAQLICDVQNCARVYPEIPRLGTKYALPSMEELRNDALRDGWVSRREKTSKRGAGVSKDYCPFHVMTGSE